MGMVLALFRTLTVAIVAVWLPLCCCQVMALSSTGGGCCASSVTTEPATHCCGDGHDDCDERDSAPTAPVEHCTHCVDKGMPPAPVALDAFFVMAQVPCVLALPPTVIDPAFIHATACEGRWDLAPPGDPPLPAPCASRRCSQLSLWLI